MRGIYNVLTAQLSNEAASFSGRGELKMRIILILIMLFMLTESSIASDIITETKVNDLLKNWIAAQNTGSYSSYANMYSNNFVGIKRSGSKVYKFDRIAWLKDRKRMFNNKMVVIANNPDIQVSGSIGSLKFEQEWESGNYKDKGTKLLVLALENKDLKITREEMLFSRIVSDNTKKDSKINDDIIVTISDSYDFTSKYTSILDKDCSKVPLRLLIGFKNAESAYECPAIKGWRLFKVYDRDSERSWLNIAKRRVVWSTANQVRINPKYVFGYFPNIDYSSRVEWRISNNNVPIALIFRVAVTDPNPKAIRVDSWLSRLYVISLKGDEPRFCGIATTNEEAREIADKALNCIEFLIKENNI
jgi:hypothetical protein